MSVYQYQNIMSDLGRDVVNYHDSGSDSDSGSDNGSDNGNGRLVLNNRTTHN